MFDFNFFILLTICGLGMFGNNLAIIVSTILLMIIKITPLNSFLPFVSKNSLNLGVIILTIGVLAPIASGAIEGSRILKNLISFKSLIAILIGIVVAWVAGKGVKVLSTEPDVLISLMIGTIAGVILFKGLPVGPLIAAGIYALIIMKF